MARLHSITCAQCDEWFIATTKDVNRGRKYCSRSCYYASKERPPAERFRDMINKESGFWWNGIPCWDFTGALQPNGYGHFGPRVGMNYAHRYAWELAHGPIPDGLHVLHHCDRRCCVNPAHLFVGTRSDNMADMVSKGRAARMAPQGESHHNAKLTEADVRAIRAAVAAGESRVAVGRRFGVRKPTVRGIVLRRSWRHVE